MQCYICNSESELLNQGSGDDGDHLNCPRCGEYKISRTAVHTLKSKSLTEEQIDSISTYLKNNQVYVISTVNLDDLLIS